MDTNQTTVYVVAARPANSKYYQRYGVYDSPQVAKERAEYFSTYSWIADVLVIKEDG